MKIAAPWRQGVLLLGCLGMLVPASPVQAAVAAPTQVIEDVELAPGGILHGQVVDVDGRSLGQTPVALRRDDRQAAATVTDPAGRFVAEGLQGGVYQLAARQSMATVRLWTAGTAPPTARQAAVLVAGGQPVRGQCGDAAAWLANPWVLAAIVAAAIAVPVAIHNSRIDCKASP